jgi:hypothetical protein
MGCGRGRKLLMTKEDDTEREVLRSLEKTSDYSQEHFFQKEVFNWMLDLTSQQSVIIEKLVVMSQDLKAANEKLSNAGK